MKVELLRYIQDENQNVDAETSQLSRKSRAITTTTLKPPVYITGVYDLKITSFSITL